MSQPKALKLLDDPKLAAAAEGCLLFPLDPEWSELAEHDKLEGTTPFARDSEGGILHAAGGGAIYWARGDVLAHLAPSLEEALRIIFTLPLSWQEVVLDLLAGKELDEADYLVESSLFNLRLIQIWLRLKGEDDEGAGFVREIVLSGRQGLRALGCQQHPRPIHALAQALNAGPVATPVQLPPGATPAMRLLRAGLSLGGNTLCPGAGYLYARNPYAPALLGFLASFTALACVAHELPAAYPVLVTIWLAVALHSAWLAWRYVGTDWEMPWGNLIVGLSLGALWTFSPSRLPPLGHPHVVTLTTRGLQPALLPGDRVLVASDASCARGEVILFETEEGKLRISRVVALGGDRVEILERKLLLDGKEVTEPYATWEKDVPDMDEHEVPAGFVFVLGDERAVAIDSRTQGPIPVARVRGPVRRVLFSLRARLIPRWDRLGLPASPQLPEPLPAPR